MAMLFPIQWDEPFGLVLIEAKVPGTPVLALPGGAVSEIVRDGVSGCVCHSIDELASRVKRIGTTPVLLRRYAEEHFSLDRMAALYARLYQSVSGTGSR